MKILILIIASEDSIHQADLITQRETWVDTRNKNIQVIYLRGWNRNSYFLNQDTLYVPCQEKYNLILAKTILGIKYALKNLHFDVLIRSNVSTYFETNKLVKELEKPIYQEQFIGGYFDQSQSVILKNKKNKEYISGTGIFLSKKAAEILITLNPENYLGIFDDIAIYDFLKNTELRKIRMKRSNLHSTNFFIPSYHIRVKNSFDSSSASRRMILVHGYFQAKSVKLKTFAYFKILLNEIGEFNKNSEPLGLFLLKNRVVVSSYIKFKRDSILRSR